MPAFFRFLTLLSTSLEVLVNGFHFQLDYIANAASMNFQRDFAGVKSPIEI